MTSTLAFFYQLVGANYTAIAARSFTLGVVDAGDSKLTSAQLSSLAASGKSLMAYASVGEAETFRDYYKDGHWDTNPPSFMLGHDPNWDTAYRVKFWDAGWQKIVIDRILSLQAQGYHGAYLDVVDAYTIPEVQAAYAIDHPGASIRAEMAKFVEKISATLKAIDPDFKIMVQNAVGLLNKTDINSLTETLNPDTDYLNAIDALGKESTFTLGDTYPISWGAWDKRYVENAVNAGKLVVSLEYPTLGNTAAENYAYTQALAAGYVPYLDVRDHTGQFTKFSKNYQTESDLSATRLTQLQDFADPSTTVVTPTPTPDHGTDDTLIGDAGNNLLSGGGGNDTLYGLDGNDTLNGDAGGDFLYGWNGDDSLSGGDGNDVLYGDAGADTLHGDGGNDYLYGWTGNDLIYGDSGNDVVYGDDGNDTIYAGDGNDIVYGSTGNDSIDGGAGDDDLFGDEGNDTVIGGDGNDRLYGWTGDDSLIGGNGNDSISGDAGNDTIDAGAGNDWVYAGDGNDLVRLGDGNDWAFGDAGNDTIYGDGGDDVIFSWTGDDSIIGGAGNDFISAEQGNDTIDGGAGNDTLWGGTGADLFVYNGGNDIIKDFAHGVDHIQITGFGTNYATVVTAHLVFAGGGATITFDANNSLHIDNVTAATLTTTDFVLN